MGGLFIPYPEKRGLQNIQMSLPHQFRKELQEECHQQHPDMHAIHIGIRGNNNVVIAQVFIVRLQCSVPPAAG